MLSTENMVFRSGTDLILLLVLFFLLGQPVQEKT